MNKLMIALASSATLAIAACGDTAETDTMNSDMATTNDMAMANDMNAGMDGGETIVATAQGNSDFSTLTSLVQQAELTETLNGPGPFTVFAPTNAAFEKIDQATRDSLMEDANRDQLAGILQYHVVDGEVNAQQLMQQIEQNGGSYEINTLGGGTLTATMDGDNVILTDANGGTSTIATTDVDASNGIIHGIDTVLMPQS